MFDVLNIPPPVLSGGAEGMLIGLATIVAGLVLLAFGRVVVWRVVSALLLAAAGAGIGWTIAKTVKVSPTVAMVIAAAVLAVLGAALARLWWALLLGTALATAGLLIVLHVVLTSEAARTPKGFTDAMTLWPWLGQAAQTVGQWLKWLGKNHSLATFATGGSLLLLGLVVGVARSAGARILGTCLLGAAMVVTGGCMMLMSVRTGLDVVTGWRGVLAMAAGLVLAGLGIAYQARAQRRSEKKTDEQAEAAPPATRPPAASKGP